MVGVPGRSRACATCKKRRIACDGIRPHCGPCIRSDRVCVYPQKHIFVLNCEGSHKTIYRKRPQPEVAHYDASGSGVKSSKEHGRSDDISRGSSTALISRPFGSLTALQQQLIHRACTGQTSATIGRPWSLAISAFADSTHALNSAPLACFASWSGRRNRDPYLVEVSQRLYVQGLREVQQAVNDPSRALRDETFAACFGLIIYEALECPDRSQRGYDVHIDGCSRLVQLRGASMHQNGASHNLFCAFRFVDILRAFETKRSTYLSSRAWTTLPWQTKPKSNWDLLLDILAEGPGALQKADRLSSMPPHRFLPAVIEMVEELLALENRMQAYYADLSTAYSEPLYWELPLLASDIDSLDSSSWSQQLTSHTAIHFQDIMLARILTLYWSSLSMVLSGLNELRGTVQALVANNILGGPYQHVHRSLALELRDWLDPIRKVCQSASFCKTDPSQIGPMVMAAPLDMVLGVMKRKSGCSPEYAEASGIRQEISSDWLRVLRFSNQQV